MGGIFNKADWGGSGNPSSGIDARDIAKWDGNAWSALGSGIGSALNDIVNALGVTANGVYAGGDFMSAGGQPSSHFAAYIFTTPGTPPGVSSDPASQVACQGGTATFSAAATGSTPLSVQWQVSPDGGANFSDLSGATSSTLTLSSVTASQNGYQYRAVFSNSCGTATSAAATLTVNTAPAISTHPQSQTVCAGRPVRFSVAASGTAPLSYQWRKNGSDIPGATSATYSITAASVADAGSYDVVVTNSCGMAVSNAATLTVNTAPAITTQPDSQTVRAGQTVTFTSTASGTPTPSVQWQVKSGSGPFTNIPGATSTTLSFTAVAANDGNKYRAVFTNSCGTAQSKTVKLTVKL